MSADALASSVADRDVNITSMEYENTAVLNKNKELFETWIWGKWEIKYDYIRNQESGIRNSLFTTQQNKWKSNNIHQQNVGDNQIV